MRDAAVDRLSRLLSDSSSHNNPGGPPPPPRGLTITLHLGLEEGWFSLFLLAAVVYSTIWCVQAAGWVDHMGVLSITTGFGLVIGVITAKQRRFPPILIHIIAIAFGLLLTLWQTASAYDNGSIMDFLHALQHWLNTAFAGGSGDDDSIFFFLIIMLGYTLAYASAWLVYRTRNPWLMIVANAVVLLINLSNIDAVYIFFLVIFLMSSLMLLLRFNLYDSTRRWKRQGLRYADDVGWDVMQAGTIISIAILVISWILPYGYSNQLASQVWSVDANPWVQVQNTWNRLIVVNGGSTAANHGNFTDTLRLGGNPHLTNDIVFTVQTTDTNQYLQSVIYDTYTGLEWTNSPTEKLAWKTNTVYPPNSILAHPVKETIKVVNAPGEQSPYLFGPSEITQVNLPVNILGSSDTGTVISWLAQNGKLASGQTYTTTSYVSSADDTTLRGVPMPQDAPNIPQGATVTPSPNSYDQTILSTDIKLPTTLDPRIRQLALQITAGQRTMYDKVLALETYFQRNFTYSLDVQKPSNVEGVSWFLFQSDHKGFCNYFASSMTVMLRSLGIPARVAAGYTNGQLDKNSSNQSVIRGTDAHAWVQVYFARYGWINFEPSASFKPFARPVTSATGSDTLPGLPANTQGAGKPNQFHRGQDPEGVNPGSGSTSSLQVNSTQLRQQVGLALGSLILLIIFTAVLFTLWWQRLFRRFGLADRAFARLCLLANWAGIPLQQAQTPYEYVHELAQSNPRDGLLIERLGDIYVRERWADPDSTEHPRQSGEINEMDTLWKHLQPRLFLYVLRHPHFLSWLPRQLVTRATTFRQRLRTRRSHADDDL